jgi:ABC-type oligopeptide transport system substrate-binding subunit
MYAVLLVFVIISVSVIAISKNKSLRNHTSARGQPIEVHHSARPPNGNPRVPNLGNYVRDARGSRSGLLFFAERRSAIQKSYEPRQFGNVMS